MAGRATRRQRLKVIGVGKSALVTIAGIALFRSLRALYGVDGCWKLVKVDVHGADVSVGRHLCSALDS
ncbi:hypothetical protein IG631_00731 [Alternaria alternata]|nr:hypothetical protein IG631_00731 [Alternaria alternata]